MTTKSRSAAGTLSQDPWEQFKHRQRIGAIWLAGDFGCIGDADEHSKRLHVDFKSILTHKTFPQDDFLSVLRDDEPCALLAKWPWRLVDIKRVLAKLIKRRGEVPEEGIVGGTGTTMLGRGPHGSIDDWYDRTISAAKGWASTHRTENPGAPTSEPAEDLHKNKLVQHTPGMAETEHTKKGVQKPKSGHEHLNLSDTVIRPKLLGIEALRQGEEVCEAMHMATSERFKQLLSNLEGFEGSSKVERQEISRRVTRLAHRLGLVLMAQDQSGEFVPVTLRCRGQKYEVRRSGGFPIASYDTFPPLATGVRDGLPNNLRA